MSNSKTTCPCGSGRDYSACCEPIIKGTSLATTAEELMRARYTAYEKQEIDFIINTCEANGDKTFITEIEKIFTALNDKESLEKLEKLGYKLKKDNLENIRRQNLENIRRQNLENIRRQNNGK